MNLNSILFPAPTCKFSPEDLIGELIWIPKTLTSDDIVKPVYFFNSDVIVDRRPVPRSYNNHPQKREGLKAADTICKPDSNDPGLDDISIITTTSTRKLNGGDDKLKVNEGDFDEEEEEKGSDTIIPNYVKNIDSSVKNSPSSHLTPKNFLAATDFVKENGGCESVNVSLSVIDEPATNLVSINYSRIPNPSLLNERVKKAAIDQKSKVNSIIPDVNTLFQGKKSPKAPLKFTLVKESQTKIAAEKANKNAKGQPNSQPSQLTRDQSMSSFDPRNMDEFGGQKGQTCAPHNLSNYFTRTLTKPISEKVTESKADDDENEDLDMKFDLITDLIEDISNPFTHRKAMTQYAINPLLFSEKKLELTTSVFAPSPQKKHTELHNYRHSEIGFKAFNQAQALKKSNVPPLAQKKNEMGYIPCRLLCSGAPACKIIVYFHGNGEDVNLAYDLLSHIRNNLNVTFTPLNSFLTAH